MYVRWSMDTARSISYRKASFSVEWRNICAAFKQSQFELFAYVHNTQLYVNFGCRWIELLCSLHATPTGNVDLSKFIFSRLEAVRDTATLIEVS